MNQYLAAVHKDAENIRFVPADMLTDAIMYEAISQSPASALYIIDKLTPCMWTELLSRDGMMLQYMPEHMKTDYACKIAISQKLLH